NEATDSSIASAGNLRKRVISGLSLNTNSVIEIRGTSEGGEYSRVDYINIAPVGSAPTPGNVNSTTGIGKLEAELMTLTGYTPENSSPSSGGKVINVGDGSGTAATRFTGSEGKYDLKLVYHDENDGKSSLSVKVDGKTVDSWILDEATDSAIASVGNRRERVISGLTLKKDSVIEIQGASDQKEYSRVDYIEIAAAGPQPPSGSSKLKILPLGDSNTKGEGTPGGYRIKFWERAVNDGVAIDFVGTRNNGPSQLGDGDHQGQGGWSIPQMTSWIKAGNLAAQNPDIILFMMGTNDANTDGAVSGAAIRDRLSTLIDEVAKAVPKAHLFVSSLLPMDSPKGTAAEIKAVNDFNALIPGLVQQKAAQGKRVSYVNAGGSLNVGDINGDNSATKDENDGLHATAAGYDKLGNAWYNAVSQSSVWKNSTAYKSAALVEADQAYDQLTGDSNDNLLEGGFGADILTGGGGADAFIYRKPSDGIDTITDFSSNDSLWISASGFGGDLVAGSTLSSSAFSSGSNPSASSGSSTFLYNTANQTLSFDVDGTGSGSAVGIATFSNGFALQASQIEIIA
ncbi:MAG: SGNH/GDSL hydrolase family protein, partial [Phormidesmis sp.]